MHSTTCDGSLGPELTTLGLSRVEHRKPITEEIGPYVLLSDTCHLPALRSLNGEEGNTETCLSSIAFQAKEGNLEQWVV
jgi:hypothetical protein